MTKRIKAVAEAAVPDWVQREARRFQYPDLDTIGAAAIPAGGGGAPTIVVAASDATAVSKTKADIICTGVNDQAVIQEAIDALVTETQLSNAQGFRVLLTEGEFAIDMSAVSFGGIELPYGTIQGMGLEATILNAGNTSGTTDDPVVALMTTRGTVRDLSIQGGAGSAVTGIWSDGFGHVVDNCHIETNGIGVMIRGQAARVHSCEILTNAGQIAVNIIGDASYSQILSNYLGGGFGVFVGGGGSVLNHGTVIGNTIEAINDGIDLGSGVIGAVVAGNVIDGGANGIETLNPRNSSIIGNTINSVANNAIRVSWSSALIEGEAVVVDGNTIRQPGEHGIFVDARTGGGFSQPAVFSNNVIVDATFDGMRFDVIDDVTIEGNLMWEPGRNGIATNEECQRFHVHGNTIIRPGQATDNTYDGINIDSTSDEWFVHGNKIMGDPSTPQPRYGISSPGVCHIVVGNSLGATTDYGTDVLNPGADTQLFWPADATYGDNFTDCATSP